MDLSTFCHRSIPIHPSPNNRPCVFPLGSHHFSPTQSMSCLRWNWIFSSFLPRRGSIGLGSGLPVNQKPQLELFIHGCISIQLESMRCKETWTWKDRDMILLGTLLPAPRAEDEAPLGESRGERWRETKSPRIGPPFLSLTPGHESSMSPPPQPICFQLKPAWL